MTPVHFAFEITPLTHKGRDRRAYVRREEVSRQLEELSISPEEVLLKRIKIEQEEDKESIKSESLVFLYRQYMTTALADDIFITLSLRIRRLVNQFRGRFVNSEVDFEDFLQSMNFSVLEKIADESDAGDYAQVSFGPFVLGLAQNLLRKQYRENKLIKATDSLDESIDGTDEAPKRINLVSSDLSAENRLLIYEAINSVSEPYRTAWLLYHLDGYQIESKDADETTIAKLLGVTGRTVRNRLTEAQKQIEVWKGGSRKAL